MVIVNFFITQWHFLVKMANFIEIEKSGRKLGGILWLREHNTKRMCCGSIFCFILLLTHKGSHKEFSGPVPKIVWTRGKKSPRSYLNLACYKHERPHGVSNLFLLGIFLLPNTEIVLFKYWHFFFGINNVFDMR